jgi:hypothetical protein
MTQGEHLGLLANPALSFMSGTALPTPARLAELKSELDVNKVLDRVTSGLARRITSVPRQPAVVVSLEKS